MNSYKPYVPVQLLIGAASPGGTRSEPLRVFCTTIEGRLYISTDPLELFAFGLFYNCRPAIGILDGYMAYEPLSVRIAGHIVEQ